MFTGVWRMQKKITTTQAVVTVKETDGVMNKIAHLFLTGLFSLMIITGMAFAQGQRYQGPDDSAGDIAARRAAFMNGNRVLLYFQNTTELSKWPDLEMSKWPNNYDGVRMLDGIARLIGALVFVKDDHPLQRIEVMLSMLNSSIHLLFTDIYRRKMDKIPWYKDWI
jgi:hypothetical protein